MDNLEIQFFDFIPTLSALAVSNPNWYSSITTNSVTPFVNYHVPTVNENHVTLTTTNQLFAYNEIVQGQLGLNPLAIEQLQVKNPMGSQLELYAPNEVTASTLQLTDMTGKIIWTSSLPSFSGLVTVPMDLSVGAYLLTLSNESGKKTFKLMKS